MIRNKGNIAKYVFGFVLIIDIVNLFADMTYEGARDPDKNQGLIESKVFLS